MTDAILTTLTGGLTAATILTIPIILLYRRIRALERTEHDQTLTEADELQHTLDRALNKGGAPKPPPDHKKGHLDVYNGGGAILTAILAGAAAIRYLRQTCPQTALLAALVAVTGATTCVLPGHVDGPPIGGAGVTVPDRSPTAPTRPVQAPSPGPATIAPARRTPRLPAPPLPSREAPATTAPPSTPPGGTTPPSSSPSAPAAAPTPRLRERRPVRSTLDRWHIPLCGESACTTREGRWWEELRRRWEQRRDAHRKWR